MTLPSNARYFVPVFVGVLLVFNLSGCQTTGNRDAAGRGMSLTEWKDIELHELDLDSPLWIPYEISGAQKQIRDNQVRHDKIKFASGNGQVKTQRVLDGFYSQTAQGRTLDEEYFKKTFSKLKEKHPSLTFQNIEKISRRGGGYCAVLNTSGWNSPCVFATIGYKLGPSKYDNDFGQFDTFLDMRYCGSDASCTKFNDLFTKVRVVSDRGALRAAIKSIAIKRKLSSTSTP